MRHLIRGELRIVFFLALATAYGSMSVVRVGDLRCEYTTDLQESRITSDGGLIVVRELDEVPVAGPVRVGWSCTANPTDNCAQRQSGVCYQSGWRSVMEIPA